MEQKRKDENSGEEAITAKSEARVDSCPSIEMVPRISPDVIVISVGIILTKSEKYKII